MRWSALRWFVVVVAVVMLQGNSAKAAPRPRNEDMFRELLKLDQMYSSIARPRINHTQLKKEFQEKYKSRVTKLLNTLLSGGNLIKAINSWAVPVLTYSFGIVKWSVTDLDELDRLTRRLLTKFRHLHTNSSVIRLYLPRRRGGRGLLNIKNQCLNQEASLRRKLLTNRDPLITAVAREDAGYTPLSLGCSVRSGPVQAEMGPKVQRAINMLRLQELDRLYADRARPR
ncbi:hypothetical protein NQ318_015407 [Aromia moschata]|uniref:Uncharacterized protein n=1 Tax=Aromia moschata TaxID=1265417 RepID=A0AAV8YQV6_9CUCU|nr:hypothetical protein NQ318_015407 [Aromia moschata]